MCPHNHKTISIVTRRPFKEGFIVVFIIMIKIVNFMMPMDKFGEMDKFGNGRRREIKNHSERRNDNFLQTSLLRCNSVNHERLS